MYCFDGSLVRFSDAQGNKLAYALSLSLLCSSLWSSSSDSLSFRSRVWEIMGRSSSSLGGLRRLLRTIAGLVEEGRKGVSVRVFF
jgi:hypothetical protein